MTTEILQFNEQIRGRTLKLAINIHDVLGLKKIPVITRPAVNQIIRSSASVAANYRAATRSRSDAEFFSKICVVVEECDETQFWLDYLARTGVVTDIETKEIQQEADELVRLFTSIKKK